MSGDEQGHPGEARPFDWRDELQPMVESDEKGHFRPDADESAVVGEKFACVAIIADFPSFSQRCCETTSVRVVDEFGVAQPLCSKHREVSS